jgi:hypothetical protein
MNYHKVRNIEFMGTSTAQIGAGFLKSLCMLGAGMPQFYRREIATGDLAQVTGALGDAVSTKSPYEDRL